MAMKLEFSGDQIDGDRDYQEDAFEVFDGIPLAGGKSCTLFVLCDGMGGHAGGRTASNLAKAAFGQSFTSSSVEIRERLEAALWAANEAVANHIKDQPEFDGMGTTLVGAMIVDNLLHWVSVGDSPMWLSRDGQLKRLNEDHSLAPVLDRMVEIGELNAEDAKTDPKRHQLRSALTGGELELIDLPENSIVIRPGDQLLLASDGVDTLSKSQISDLLKANASGSAVRGIKDILRAVKGAAKPHQDNATLILCRIMAADPPTVRIKQGSAVDELNPDADTDAGTAAESRLRSPLAISLFVAVAALILLSVFLLDDEDNSQPPSTAVESENAQVFGEEVPDDGASKEDGGADEADDANPSTDQAPEEQASEEQESEEPSADPDTTGA